MHTVLQKCLAWQSACFILKSCSLVHLIFMHPVTSENQFHCTRLYTGHIYHGQCVKFRISSTAIFDSFVHFASQSSKGVTPSFAVTWTSTHRGQRLVRGSTFDLAETDYRNLFRLCYQAVAWNCSLDKVETVNILISSFFFVRKLEASIISLTSHIIRMRKVLFSLWHWILLPDLIYSRATLSSMSSPVK